MSSNAPWTARFLCSAAIIALPLPVYAQAGADEIAATAGVGYAGIPGFAGDARGVRLYGQLAWGFGHDLSLVAFGSRDEFFGKNLRGAATTAGLGLAYNIDVLTVVPFIALTPVFQTVHGDLEDAGSRFGLRGALGADWRRWRSWSVGGQIEWLGFFPQIFDYPAEAAVTARFTWYFDLQRW